jgi:GT2 family glycosyltransferase
MTYQNNKAPLVSIITVNYNNSEITSQLLKSIEINSYKNVEVIVVDNASKDFDTQILIQAYANTLIIESEVNLGFAGGNNLGLDVAKGDFLFLVNNDTEFTDGLIEGLLDVFSKHEDAGMVSPKFHYFFHKGTIEYAGYQKVNSWNGRNKMIGCREIDHGQYDRLSVTHYAHGGGMMLSRKVLEDVGNMPEVFFLYYEEFDWCETIKKAGYKIYYQPASLIYHKESMTTGKNSTLKTYYITRNRLLFMRRNSSFLNLLLFLFYFTFITIPKNTLNFLIHSEYQHLKAFWKAVLWNVRN